MFVRLSRTNAMILAMSAPTSRLRAQLVASDYPVRWNCSESGVDLGVCLWRAFAFFTKKFSVLPGEGVYFLQGIGIGFTYAPVQEAMPNQSFNLCPLIAVGLLWWLELACKADARATALGTG
jgi:hypothetical protein